MKRDDSGSVPGSSPADCVAISTALQLVFALTLCAVWSLGASASERSLGEQLARMSHALRSLSYEGTLVYLHDNKLETLRIAHRVEDGQVHEHLISLNGPVRTITREKGNVTCELSSTHPIFVPGHGLERDLLRPRTIDAEGLADHYRVHSAGSARVAGRQADVVQITPRDGLRYGYRFYLDQETGLPLKSDLMGQESEPIEQIMFAALQIESPAESPVSSGLVSSGPVSSGPVSSGSAAAPRQRDAVPRIPDSVPWRFVALPVGFSLVMHDIWRDTSGEPVAHFVFSDGLASISVYVESDPEEGLQGATSIGAVHAAGNRVSGHQVTVVGEVPSVTVEAVLAAVRHVGGEAR